MPTTAEILGFTNRWYAEATAHAMRREIAPGLAARVASALYFVAMKLEAFAGRGDGNRGQGRPEGGPERTDPHADADG